MARRLHDLERLAYAYAELCALAYAYDGLSTLETLRGYNTDERGLGFQIPAALSDAIQVSEVHLDDADLAAVAARIDEMLATTGY